MAAPQVRSRFLARGESDSDESTSTEGSGAGKVAAAVRGPANRFQLEESDSESEDEGRVVRSEKDKKFEAINVIITAIRNQLRQNNWVETQDCALWGVLCADRARSTA